MSSSKASAPPVLRCALRCLLSSLCLAPLLSCGTQSALSGIWQQVNFSPEQGLLYEFHLGQYGDQLTGLIVRYRSPLREELGAYEKLDRCDCFFIRQGRVGESGVSFRLFSPSMTRSVNGGARCAPAREECPRVFEFQEDSSGGLRGESWCEGKRDERLPLTLSAVDGVSIERCWLPEEEPGADQAPPLSQRSDMEPPARSRDAAPSDAAPSDAAPGAAAPGAADAR